MRMKMRMRMLNKQLLSSRIICCGSIWVVLILNSFECFWMKTFNSKVWMAWRLQFSNLESLQILNDRPAGCLWEALIETINLRASRKFLFIWSFWGIWIYLIRKFIDRLSDLNMKFKCFQILRRRMPRVLTPDFLLAQFTNDNVITYWTSICD